MLKKKNFENKKIKNHNYHFYQFKIDLKKLDDEKRNYISY